MFMRMLQMQCCVAYTVMLVPKPFGGADRVGGQLRGDKECHFSGVTSCGRVWRKVPESERFGANKIVEAT